LPICRPSFDREHAPCERRRAVPGLGIYCQLETVHLPQAAINCYQVALELNLHCTALLDHLAYFLTPCLSQMLLVLVARRRIEQARQARLLHAAFH